MQESPRLEWIATSPSAWRWDATVPDTSPVKLWIFYETSLFIDHQGWYYRLGSAHGAPVVVSSDVSFPTRKACELAAEALFDAWFGGAVANG